MKQERKTGAVFWRDSLQKSAYRGVLVDGAEFNDAVDVHSARISCSVSTHDACLPSFQEGACSVTSDNRGNTGAGRGDLSDVSPLDRVSADPAREHAP